MEIIPSPDAISNDQLFLLKEQVDHFITLLDPLEKGGEYFFIDSRTGAIFFECHIKAQKLVELSTIDVPLDPENQAEYRANRDIVEDHDAYIVMKSDALRGRSFSNIVGEWNQSYDEEHPFKIIGGQHRYNAISEAHAQGVDEYHGVKAYFLLDTKQRLDVQLISNTNIAVAGDLLDRMYETMKGPELRNWCQEAGLLGKELDFSDRKQRGSRLTVRGARTFILSYFEGKEHLADDFEHLIPLPIISKTGGQDEDWDKLRSSQSDLWIDAKLKEAGKQYATLIEAQHDAITKRDGSLEFSDKAQSYAVISSWAYIAGLLAENGTRLNRHYELAKKSTSDPLNAAALAKGRHKSDPHNYRGLGTRTDVKDRGRLVELFYAQAEKGEGISTKLVDYAVKNYHSKLAFSEADEAKRKIQ